MKRLFPVIVLLLLPLAFKAQVLILEGHYKGENMYIQNPISSTGTGFCTRKVLVNDKEVPFTNASAYVIPLDSLGLGIGEKLKIEIHHAGDCKPKVISTHHGHPKCSFEIISMSIDSPGRLKWTTKNELSKMPYTIEQFRWHKWVKVGEVEGKGDMEYNEYTYDVPLHSGKNRVRVKQGSFTTLCISKPVEIVSDVKNRIVIIDPFNIIEFSSETMYEVYDASGNIIKKGYGKSIDCSGLRRKQKYYLNYENEIMEFRKR
jgi:hypothetical protein